MDRKILAFGEVMMRLATPDYLTLSQTNTLHVTYTGTGLNVLSALSHFGLTTSLVTKLPKNSLGDAAISHIRSLGIETDFISRGGKYLGKYFLEQGFSARPSVVTYSNRRENSFCQSKVEDYPLEQIFSSAKMIHFCGITLAISRQTRELLLYVIEKAKSQDLIVVFDSNFRPKLWNQDYEKAKHWYEKILPYVDLCFMTDLDAKHILGLPTKKKNRKHQLKDLLQRVSKKYHIETIAGTLREFYGDKKQSLQGFIIKNEEIIFSRKHTFHVLDRIGGGDGFASGIMYGHLEKLSLQERIEFATAAGVLAHTTYGDSPISKLEDIWQFVKAKSSCDVKR